MLILRLYQYLGTGCLARPSSGIPGDWRTSWRPPGHDQTWPAARTGPPSYTGEMNWTCLLFSSTCIVCLKGRLPSLPWDFHLRIIVGDTRFEPGTKQTGPFQIWNFNWFSGRVIYGAFFGTVWHFWYIISFYSDKKETFLFFIVLTVQYIELQLCKKWEL